MKMNNHRWTRINTDTRLGSDWEDGVGQRHARPAAARRLRVSRSELYAMALWEFLRRRQASAVTERLNEAYSRRPAKVDGALRRAQLGSLEKGSW